jgi:hypothetical protein
MATDRNILKQWFVRGAKPLAAQFAAWIDSFWHKDDMIPANKIEGLQEAIAGKADQSAVTNIANDLTVHKTDTAAHEDIRNAVAAEAEARELGDTNTLTEAKGYTDQKVSNAVNQNYFGAFWLGKTTPGFSVPLPTDAAQNYFDFTTNTPYTALPDLSGWQAGTPITPVNGMQIGISSKFWDIAEAGYPGFAKYNAAESSWDYYPDMTKKEDNDTIKERNSDGAWEVASQSFNITESITKFTSGATLTFKAFWQAVLGKLNGVIALFDTGTGHDHNGTNSKKIAYSDIDGTPTKLPADGGNAATVASMTPNEIAAIRPLIAGKMVYTDPTFKFGLNSVAIYDNTGDAVTVNRVARSGDNPTKSDYELKVESIKPTDPELGGVVLGSYNYSRANAIFYKKIIAKIPVGYEIRIASNSIGNDALKMPITPVFGTGKWEEYIWLIKCGSTGTFSTFGHLYIIPLNGQTTVEWRVAYATIFDATDAEDTIPNQRNGSALKTWYGTAAQLPEERDPNTIYFVQ